MAEPITGPLADLYPQSLIYEPPSSIDGEGTITYGTAVTIACRVKGQHRIVRDRDGREQVSSVQAWLAGVFDVEADGRFTLPAGYDPQQPKAISVELVPDENGPHHEVVMFK